MIIAYAGLNPKLRESDLFKGRTRISKLAQAELSKALYRPALAAISCNAVVEAQWDHRVSRHKGAKIGRCAAMRKLLQLAYQLVRQ